jgi:hypothetical protein
MTLQRRCHNCSVGTCVDGRRTEAKSPWTVPGWYLAARVPASCGSGVKLRGRQRLAWVKPRTGDPCAVWWCVLAWSLPGKERLTKATVALVLVSHPPPPIHRHHLAVVAVAPCPTSLWSPLSLLTLIEATLGICPLISPRHSLILGVLASLTATTSTPAYRLAHPIRSTTSTYIVRTSPASHNSPGLSCHLLLRVLTVMCQQ